MVTVDRDVRAQIFTVCVSLNSGKANEFGVYQRCGSHPRMFRGYGAYYILLRIVHDYSQLKAND